MDTIVYTAGIDRYAFFEKKSPSKFTRVCIDGHITGSNRCEGYCQYEGHPGFLTTELIKQHNCRGKACFHFVAKPKKTHETVIVDDIRSLILPHCKKAFSDYEGIKIMDAQNTGFNQYVITYISITNENNFEEYIGAAVELFGVEISFVRLNYDFDVCVELLCRT